jgi:hypothetical protein
MHCERADAPAAGNPLLSASLRLARLGYAVFPCRSGRKSQLLRMAFWTPPRTERPSATGGRDGQTPISAWPPAVV